MLTLVLMLVLALGLRLAFTSVVVMFSVMFSLLFCRMRALMLDLSTFLLIAGLMRGLWKVTCFCLGAGHSSIVYCESNDNVKYKHKLTCDRNKEHLVQTTHRGAESSSVTTTTQ